MNNKYIDFVPAKKGAASRPEMVLPKPQVASRAGSKVGVRAEAQAKPKVGVRTEAQVKPKVGVRAKSQMEFRVKPQVETQAKPQIAARVRPQAKKDEVKLARIIKSQKSAGALDDVGLGVIESLGVDNAKDSVTELGSTGLSKGSDKTFKVPKSPFINQNKVEKRPLSKNVYQKKIVVPEEKPKGPVTIISKPEKDAHVSLIVAVILTIILGAAAGTVAFLLLPK